MNSVLQIPLRASPEQTARLEALQDAFVDVCNALVPIVCENRCWNRVALHHLAYRTMRKRFPHMGSQMICNAIYSLSRTCRRIFQHPDSPINIDKLPPGPLPLIAFKPGSPVYFDRHTLSIKKGALSMYTLDGRIRFQLDLSEENERRFRDEKLREIVLANTGDGYVLAFYFTLKDALSGGSVPLEAPYDELPDYLMILSEQDDSVSKKSVEFVG